MFLKNVINLNHAVCVPIFGNNNLISIFTQVYYKKYLLYYNNIICSQNTEYTILIVKTFMGYVLAIGTHSRKYK